MSNLIPATQLTASRNKEILMDEARLEGRRLTLADLQSAGEAWYALERIVAEHPGYDVAKAEGRTNG